MILVTSILSITGTPNNGSLPIGNGQGFTVNTLTAGTNITITNGPGTITIAASGGGGTPAGNSTEIQYNNAGAFGANSNLKWDITNSRAIIGTETVADTNSRLVVIGKGQSTNTTFAVHNQLGNNNALVVRDNGFVGFGGLPFSTLRYRFSVGTNLNVYFANIGGQTSLGAVDDVTTGIQFNINGNPLVWQVATVEYLRLTSTNLRVQNTIFDVNQSIGTGQAVSLLNLNNTNNQVATSILNFTIAGGNLAQLRAEATAGDDNVQIRVTNSAGTLIEPIRFQGSGNVLIGTTTDNPRALLNLTSTSKGLLLPRMDTTQRDAVSWVAGDAGMVIFNTSTNEFQGWDGTTWKNFH